MKVGDLKDFKTNHPFVQKLMMTGILLADGKNLLGWDWMFWKLGPFLYTLSLHKGRAYIERIAKSEKKLMMSNNEYADFKKGSES